MRGRVWAWVLAPVAVACAAAPPITVPAGAVSIEDDPGVVELRSYWDAYELPDVSACAAPLWAEVPVAQFEDWSGWRTCTPRPDRFACAEAATVDANDGTAVALYAGGAETGEPISYVRAHETMHVFLRCAFGDSDVEHKRREWKLVMPWVLKRLREAYGQ